MEAIEEIENMSSSLRKIDGYSYWTMSQWLGDSSVVSFVGLSGNGYGTYAGFRWYAVRPVVKVKKESVSDNE